MISIVMAYVNRLEQTRHTLRSITQSRVTDYEIIIVDDFSRDGQRAVLLLDEFKGLNLKIISLNQLWGTKTHYNPCVAYNVGFRHASGNKIILQNPECFHAGDILDYVESNLAEGRYITFNCYALDIEDTYTLHRGGYISFSLTEIAGSTKSCWYNHHILRPVAYHFASAITRSDLDKLGGFDEAFANGVGFDDDEFLHRIRHGLGLPVEIVENPMVLHQWHENSFPNTNMEHVESNRKLFELTKLNSGQKLYSKVK